MAKRKVYNIIIYIYTLFVLEKNEFLIRIIYDKKYIKVYILIFQTKNGKQIFQFLILKLNPGIQNQKHNSMG